MSETKKAFLRRKSWRGSKNDVASAESRIWALVSGDAARRLESVVLGRRRLVGTIEGSVGGGPSVSMSREERPRCEVRSLAEARREGGVR